jgi:uncharacterized protein YndB with AHSA1/START domain
MEMTLRDTIEREIVVKASKERVYDAITDPTKIVSWFPDSVEGTLAVGERPTFVFDGHGRVEIYVVDAKPYEYFSYRWIPGSDVVPFVGDILTVPNTLVEFRIQEMGDGTKVTLKESGFASLQPDVREQKFQENSGGWEYMMDRLEKHLS